MDRYKTSRVHEVNRALVERILMEVSSYSTGKIEQVLGQYQGVLDDGVQKSWIKLTEQICHDKTYCRLLRVDYANLPKEDRLRINVAALYLAKENPDIVLPLL